MNRYSVEIARRAVRSIAGFTRLEDDIDARFTKLEENQQKIALTLARLVALFEAGDEAEAAPSG